jgi:hypothetical protein
MVTLHKVSNTQDIMKAFNELHSKLGITNVKNTITTNKQRERKNTSCNWYERYKEKLDKGELEKFNTRDMLYFFKEKAEENNIRFVIGNAKIYMHNFKVLQTKGYSKEDILAMIEFLFDSGQNYLPKDKLHPGILLTNWCNTIYQDTQLWLKDEYVPRTKQSSKRQKLLKHREWQKKDKDESVIGEWGI